MESTRLLNLIYDLLEADREIKLALTEIQTAFANIQNPNHSIDQKKIFADQYRVHLTKLDSECAKSIANNLSPSNSVILMSIGGQRWFGNCFFEVLKETISNNTYAGEIQKIEFDKMLAARVEFIEKITKIRDALTSINLNPHFSTEFYEIGVLVPSKSRFSKLGKFSDLIKGMNFTARTISEITTGDTSDIEITCVNNGSIEFFFEKSIEFIGVFAKIFGAAKAVSNGLKKFESAKSTLAEVGDSEEIIEAIEAKKHLIVEKTKDRIALDLVESIDGKSEAEINELKNKITKCIDFALSISSADVKVEINEPYISEPKRPKTESQDELLEHEQQASQIQAFRERMSAVSACVRSVNDFALEANDALSLIESSIEESDGE